MPVAHFNVPVTHFNVPVTHFDYLCHTSKKSLVSMSPEVTPFDVIAILWTDFNIFTYDSEGSKTRSSLRSKIASSNDCTSAKFLAH